MRQLHRVFVPLLALAACNRANTECRIRPADQDIVNHALDVYGNGKISRNELLASNIISVVYLPKMTCVGFNLKPGTAGGDDTLCFDKDGRMVLSYRDGQ